MKKDNLRISLYLVLVFVSGTLVGAFGHRLYTVNSVSATTERPKSPDDYRRDYLNEMRVRLKLRDDQAANLEKILDRTREQYRLHREKTKPETEAIQNEQTEAVRAILSPDQNMEYEKMRAEREARKRQNPPPPRP